MASHIVIDARRIRDFGIGTYIRSLVQALGSIDRNNQYTLVSGPADVRTLAGLPENFHSAVYTRDDHSALDHVAFPLFLRGLSPDLVHIPLARVPLLMMRPSRIPSERTSRRSGSSFAGSAVSAVSSARRADWASSLQRGWSGMGYFSGTTELTSDRCKQSCRQCGVPRFENRETWGTRVYSAADIRLDLTAEG